MADTSKADLKKEIQLILKDANLENTSAKKVRLELQEKLDCDLTERKKEVDQLVMEVIDEQEEKSEEEEEVVKKPEKRKGGGSDSGGSSGEECRPSRGAAAAKKKKAAPKEEKAAPKVKEKQYEVEKIMDRRERRAGVVEFLVKWKGWDDGSNTWEPRQHLEGTAEDAIREFEEKRKRDRNDNERINEVKNKKTKVENGKEEKGAEEQIEANQESDDGEDDVEIKVKMKSKTFFKYVDKATTFLNAAAKVNQKEDKK